MSTPALELDAVVKRFGALTAVDSVSLRVEAGEVLALIGENGAGKSTLIQVACGLYTPDSGSVRAFGKPLVPGDPRAAIDAGVGVVYQHFMLVPPLPVWENVVLGQEPRRFGLLDRERARREVREAAQRAGLSIDVDAPVESLTVGAQQRVEIVKQLWRGAKVLILDEPTAVLTPSEADDLVRTVRKLAADGHAIVFISHKLREVLAVADRVAVLRRGKLVLEARAAETTARSLAEAVTGGATALLDESPVPPPRSDKPRLVVRELACEGLEHVSFNVGAGEVLGIAGVDGNGQSELAEALTGLRPAYGQLQLDGAQGWARSPAAARAAGVVHLPEDRLRRALCLPLSLEENLALGWHDAPPFARGLFIDRRGRREKAQALLEQFDVRPPDPQARAGGLSGGNQQKLVAARELAGGGRPKLVVAVQPTRGLDLVATRRVHDALRKAAADGAAVLVSSLDLDELRALCSRILVLYDGRISGEAAPTASDAELGRLMLGQAHA